MLVQFSVENFLSFQKENILNMLATADKNHSHHLVPNKKKKPVLRSAAIYGANGSGKSNLLQAITFAQNLIIDGTNPEQRIGVIPFKLDEKSRKSPSRFEFVINYKEVIYTYGFVVNEERVEEEWLFAVYNAREVLLFERLTKPEGNIKVIFGPKLAKKKSKQKQFLNFIAEGTRDNALFLYELYQKNVKEILPVTEWFRTVLTVIGPTSAYRDLIFDAHTNKDFIQFMGTFLKYADTGIDSIVTEKVESDLDMLFMGVPEKLKEDLKNLPNNIMMLIWTLENQQYAVMREKSGDIVLLRLKARHATQDNKYIDIELNHESDGTRRLMDLLPTLFHSRNKEKVYLIDEIDRSMHPLLSTKFVRAYLGDSESERGQLIMTTHESNLLDKEFFRRDEIWFTEKDKTGGTNLYSLAEYKVRPDLKLGKGYLDGRFGAIPFLGDLEKLQFHLKEK